jgi:tripartite-type tricarboxylate transporter receptor subunit TctC
MGRRRCGRRAAELRKVSGTLMRDNAERDPMRSQRRQFLRLAAGAAAFPAFPRFAGAQTYPSRPILFVVPFAAGGGSDIVARTVAEKMSKTLGQQIIVENRGGGGGTIAMRQVARSTPDGYTLGLGNPGTLAVAPSVYPDLGYDPRRDFAPIGFIGATPFGLIAHPSLPAQSIRELIALAKREPGKVTFASAGTGSGTHLSGELFAAMAAVKLTHIPYKGVGPALNDLLGGHVMMAVAGLPPVIAHVNEGRLRALAVTTAMRSRIFPNVPTVAEAGVPGYESEQGFGILSPMGTPRAIVDKLNAALREAIASDEVQKKMAFDGTIPLPGSPEDYAARIDREEAKWSKVIKEAGIKI